MDTKDRDALARLYLTDPESFALEITSRAESICEAESAPEEFRRVARSKLWNLQQRHRKIKNVADRAVKVGLEFSIWVSSQNLRNYK